MTFRPMGVVAILCFGLAAVGCGYDCNNFCEDEADCPGSKMKPDDCDSFCQDVDDLNDASGCDDEWDKLMDCAGDVDDICNDTDANKCSDESGTYLTCVLSWCSRHASASECN